MRFLQGRRVWVLGAVLGYALLALALTVGRGAFAAPSAAPIAPAAVFGGPTYSSPIALSNGGGFVWSVNPDDDSVSVINTQTDDLAGPNIRVGDEPQSIALDPDGEFAYVANAADNSVTVIRIVSASPFQAVVERTFTTGAEPWNIVISPDGKRVFVANSSQDTITVIKADVNFPTLPSIIGNFDIRSSACNVGGAERHFQPRGLAVTTDNTALFVTRFLSFTGGVGAKQGDDNGRVGIVCRLTINTAGANAATTFSAPTPITLAPADTGFPALIGTPPVETPTKAFANQMQSVVLCGSGANTRAYLPNIAASPSGPLKFDVDTHAFVNMIGSLGATPTDQGALNLHLGARGNTPPIFFANVWAFACVDPVHAAGTTAYAVSAGSDVLVKLNVAADGSLSFTDAANQTKFIDLNSGASTAEVDRDNGKNPQGLVIRPGFGATPTKAYVMNFVSRNVSVVDLNNDAVLKGIPTTALPAAGSEEEQILVGAEIFFSSRGKFDAPPGTTISTANRLSQNGWQNCASCHFAGLTDGIVWQFGAGPRKSVPLNGTFSPHNPDDQRRLNYSAIFNEVQDFELNIRNVSGPGNDPVTNSFRVTHGLLISDTGNINAPPSVINAFAKPNTGRPQHTVTLPGSSTAWPALDAMNAWVRFAIRTPNGVLDSDQLAAGGNTADTNGALNRATVNQGRALFFRAGCATCHGGTKWTTSSNDIPNPPPAAEIATETNPAPPAGVTPIGAQFLHSQLKDINTFNLGVAGQGNLFGDNVGAFERAAAAGVTGNAGPLALGEDHNQDGKGKGYNTPSLLGIWSLPPYYHNGSCETLACVLSNQAHRTIKGTRPDLLSSQANQDRVVAFLKTLDAETRFPLNLIVNQHDIFLDPPALFTSQTVTVGVNLSLFGTRQDLLDLLDGQPLKVKFTGPDLDSEVELAAANIQTAFKADFGQARVTTSWTVPSTPGFKQITVTVDTGNIVDESSEGDNSARRRVVVREPPPDSTPPVIESVAISDDATFNENDAIAGTSRVKVQFTVDNVASPSPSPTTDLDAFCIVRYSYNSILRRWVEERCNFQRLPAPDGGSGTTFTVDANLPAREGTIYAFVWVRDKAGNITRRPGFDFISFIPTDVNIRLARNEIRVFRLPVPAGGFNLTFTPSSGDVDVSVFRDLANPVRCAVSAQNGTTPETVAIPSVECTGDVFQIEVRAVVNSIFQIEVEETSVLLKAQPSVNVIAPMKEVPEEATVAGPPAEQTAINDVQEVNLPLIVR